MKRIIALLIALTIIVASCGGGDDEAEPATTAVAPTTSQAPSGAEEPAATLAQPTIPPDEDGTADDGSDSDGGGDEMVVEDDPATDVGEGSSTDFCTFIAEVDATQDGVDFGFDTEGFRQAMEDTVAALDQARDLAPSEIEDDVDFVFGTFVDFITLLEEYNYDFVALGTDAADDPRLLAFDEAEFEAAVERITNFCGIPTTGGDTSDGGDAGGDVIPGDIPEALIPPGVVETFDIGGGSIIVSTTASFEDVVAFFTDALGDPLFVNDAEMAAVWQAQLDGSQYSVSLSGDGETVEALIAVLG